MTKIRDPLTYFPKLINYFEFYLSLRHGLIIRLFQRTLIKLSFSDRDPVFMILDKHSFRFIIGLHNVLQIPYLCLYDFYIVHWFVNKPKVVSESIDKEIIQIHKSGNEYHLRRVTRIVTRRVYWTTYRIPLIGYKVMVVSDRFIPPGIDLNFIMGNDPYQVINTLDLLCNIGYNAKPISGDDLYKLLKGDSFSA